MARRAMRARRRRPAQDRAWLYTEGQLILGDAGDSIIQDVFNFDDIAVDELLIKQEKSEWFVKRILFWYHLVMASEFSQPSQVPVCVRLGQLSLDEFEQHESDGEIQSPEFGAEWWDRIYQEDWHMNFLEGLQSLDGLAAIVSTEGTADAPPRFFDKLHFHKWDLETASRLHEAKSVAVMLGTRFPNDGVNHTLTWTAKVMLQKAFR